MRCNNHKKEFEGACNWCGKKLCELCIARSEGRKFYCEHCAISLLPFKRQPLPAAKITARPTEQAQTVTTQAPEVKRRFMLGKDGYYELH